MFFDIGLAGVNAAAADLNVIGNNLSNANTTGFKQSNMDFMNVMSSSLNSSSSGTQASQGNGPSTSNIRQEFQQGTVAATQVSSDVAIKGLGFFQLQDPTTGQTTYSRNGTFQVNSAGNLVNSLGQQVCGYNATNGLVNAGVVAPIVMSSGYVPPTVTTSVALNINLNSASKVPPTSTFSPTDPSSYNYATSVNTYNTKGEEQTLATYYVYSGTGTTWNVYSTINAANSGSNDYVTSPTASQIGSLTFNTDGTLDTAASTITGVAMDTSGDTGTIDYTGSTHLNSTVQGSQSSTQSATANGNSTGYITGINIAVDGTINATLTSGQTNYALGQITTAMFQAPNGLRDLGNDSWAATAQSGVATVGTPASGNYGELVGSALESSNVDQTTQLVNLLAAQRAYQANAQTITVMNQALGSAIQMG
jgi:flagellar hook protein FlgE